MKHDSAPKLVFAAVCLDAGSGGIAELSRQTIEVLLEMERRNDIQLAIHVLEGASPQSGDNLLVNLPAAKLNWYGGSRWRFSAALAGARCDLVLFDHVGLARLFSLMPRSMRPEYAAFIHGVEIWSEQRRDYQRSARRAGMLIANSHYTAERARATQGGLPVIRVCWPGRGAHECEQTVGPEAVPELGNQVMLIVGRLSARQRHKGHDQLIEAMPLILQQVPAAQLLVVGQGDDGRRLQQKARDLKLNGQVLFVGWQSESQLRALYQRSAIFVMPSDGDGFGLVFLEAMMQRKACVGLRGGAAEEIFEHGKSGILVDRDNRADLAGQLVSLLQNESTRQLIGEAGYQRYRSHFQPQHYAHRLRRVVTEFLDEHVA